MHLKSRHAYKELIRAEKQMNIEIDLKINEIVKDLDAYHLFLSEKGESLLKFEKQLKEYRIMLEDLRKVILKNKDFSQN